MKPNDPETDMTLLLIAHKTKGNYGLAPKKWREQLERIRALPERAEGAKA